MSREPARKWFAVRNVIRLGGVYEERITIWDAPTFEVAEERARTATGEYARDVEGEALPFAQVYHLCERPGDGAEIFSLMRASELDADAYLSAFFATGSEHEGTFPGDAKD